MANEYDDAVGQYVDGQASQAASANLAATDGVSPEHALIGINGQVLADTPASVGMRSPEVVQQLSANRTQQDTIAASPPVRTWAATAEPAHLAVTKDDFPSLAKIGAGIQAISGNPFEDFWNAGLAATTQAFKDAQGIGQAPKGPFDISGIVAVGKTLFDASVVLPSAAAATIQEPIARGIAAIPGFDSYVPFLGTPKKLNTPAERLQAAREMVGLASLGLASRSRTVSGGPVPASTLAQRIEGPGTAANRPPPPPPGVDPHVDAARSAVAEIDVHGITQIQAQIAESQTHARSPEVMETYIAQQTGDRTVQVDPDRLVELAQQGHEPFPEDAQAISEAAQAGEPYVVPLSRYLARTAGQPFADQLNSATVFRDGGVSVEEGKELGTKEPETPTAPRTLPEPPADFTPEESTRARSLAENSHAALDEVVQEQRLRELFTEPKATGTTKSNFERYNLGVEDAIAKATDRLTQRAYDQILRERKPDWQDRIAQHSAAVEQELANSPAIRARAYIAQGKDALGAPLEVPLKLASRDPLSLHGRDLGLPDRYFSRNGLSPDDAAELLGYPSGTDLIRDLTELHTAQGDRTIAQHMKAMVRELAEARTREELGYDLDPESLHQAASEAINSPRITEFLADDLRDFAKENGLPFDQAAMTQYALDRYGSRQVKEALKLRQLEGFLAKDGRKLETALLKGDIPAAFKWKQAQFLHQVELTAAHKFVKLYAKTQRAMKSLARKPISPSMNQEARNFARAIVAEMGVPVRTGKHESVLSALKGKSLEAYVGEMTAKGLPMVHAPLPPGVTPENMTVDQFTGVSEMLQSITNLGRELMKVYRNGKVAQLRDIVDEIKANGDGVGRGLTAGELRVKRNAFLKGTPGHAARTLGSSVARPETFLFWLDGETNGPLMKYVLGPLQDGKYAKADRELQMNKDWGGFVKAQPKGWRDSLQTAVNVPELTYSVDARGNPIQWLQTRSDVIMMATHFGTESNLQKLTEGFGWDEQTVRAVADRVLTKPDWDYVQFILDQHHKLLPDVQSLYRDTVGLGIDPVPAISIPTPFGTLRGGYRHVTYDWSAVGEFTDENGEPVVVHDPNALGDSALFGNDFRVSTPSNKYTVARTGFSAPLNLSHDILHRELESVIHDIAYRRPLIQAAKILAQPAVRQTFKEVLGPEYLDQTNRWLQDIAQQANYDQSQLKFFAGMVRGLRRRFTMFQIGYNVATLVKHGGIALSHIGGEVGLPELAKASADLLGRTPENGQSLAAWVDSQSGEVRGALLNLDRDVRELIADSLREQGYLDTVRYHAFTMFGLVKQMEARATWLAKYRNLTEKQGLPHEDAVQLANKSVRDTQGAGGTVDLPALWRGDSSFWAEFGKLLNVFTNFENTATNRLWTAIRTGPRMVRGFRDGGWAGGRRDFTKIAANSWFYFALPAIVAAVFDTYSTGGGKEFLEHFYADFLKSSLGGSFPGGSIVADLPRMIKTKQTHEDVVTSMIQDVTATGVDSYNFGKHIVTGHPTKVDPRWVQHAAATVGYILNLPTKPTAKGGQYLWNITHGKEKSGAVDFFRGIIFGPKTKEHKK